MEISSTNKSFAFLFMDRSLSEYSITCMNWHVETQVYSHSFVDLHVHTCSYMYVYV